MRLLLTFLISAIIPLMAYCETIETYNYVSDANNELCHDMTIVRPINGGTIITPTFDPNCPEELKGAFSFACKIMEEYMPTSLPITVYVKSEAIETQANPISKVEYTNQHFRSDLDKSVPMSTVKGVIYGELSYHNVSNSFLDSVPNMAALNQYPDITITYNSNRSKEISYSLDASPGDCYDFVSLALRDLFIGFGFSSHFRASHQSGTFLDPIRPMTKFEKTVKEWLIKAQGNKTLYETATQGELNLYKSSTQPQIKLYAPNPWQPNVSLNYCVSSENISITQVMDYNLGKGTVARSLNDQFSGRIFDELFGWWYDYMSGPSDEFHVSPGSTSNMIPYEYISSSQAATAKIQSETPSHKTQYSDASQDNHDALVRYIESLHPFQTPDGFINRDGISFSALLKDGSWDLIKFTPYVYWGSENIDPYHWNFSHPSDDYARSPDGYLRIRVTSSQDSTISSSYETFRFYETKYYVADFIPQKVGLKAVSIDYHPTIIPKSSTASAIEPNIFITPNLYRIYFNNLEGTNRLVLEVLKEGARLPVKYNISNFKEGYYDLEITTPSKITAVAYNDNGSTRGVPINVTPSTLIITPTTSVSQKDNTLSISSSDKDSEYKFSITPLESSNNEAPVLTGQTNGEVDISNLKSGIYVLTFTELRSGETHSYKFRR